MLETILQAWKQKRNILAVIKGDFSQNYLASYLGFVWAIIGPVVSLIIIALVFRFGLRVTVVNDKFSFVAWLACGLVPWYYFNEGLLSGAASVTSYSFLVKKAMFRIGYLPPIRLCSLALTHFALMGVLIGIVTLYGNPPSLYWLQWFYYFALMYFFMLGVSWATSAVSVFVPDMNSILGVVLNLGFWATPLVWVPSLLPSRYHWLVSLNPAYYLTQGYRDAFIEEQWFWQRPPLEHAAFFIWLAAALAGGAYAFKKLRPHFADVL